MSHDWIADLNLFELLDAEDAQVTRGVKAAGCRDCGGRLDQANYPRKPRGGVVGAAGEGFRLRRSLCCAREGCRHRHTPPSLMFLGRRVYLAIAVIMCAWRTASEPPPLRRTVGRWQGWFARVAAKTPCVTELRARLSPTLAPGERLPGALIERLLPGRTIAAALTATLRLLSPLSTARP